MANALIRPMGGEYEEYLRDESRSVGKAESISFPRTTAVSYTHLDVF